MQRYLTVEEVADLLHLSRVGVRWKVKAGKLRAFKPGGKYLFRPQDVEKAIEDAEVKGMRRVMI